MRKENCYEKHGVYLNKTRSLRSKQTERARITDLFNDRKQKTARKGFKIQEKLIGVSYNEKSGYIHDDDIRGGNALRRRTRR